jgi:hypothetical protein
LALLLRVEESKWSQSLKNHQKFIKKFQKVNFLKKINPFPLIKSIPAELFCGFSFKNFLVMSRIKMEVNTDIE